MRVTVIIPAYNEVHTIHEILRRVQAENVADEIIVVDNGSSDSTRDIAKKAGAKVLHHQNQPTKLNQAKNFGFEHAASEWIISLDSDERIDADLKGQILELLKQDSILHHGFRIPRKNIIFGKWMKHSRWWPDYNIRLFKKPRSAIYSMQANQLVCGSIWTNSNTAFYGQPHLV